MSLPSGNHPLFDLWDGHVVPRSFDPGFVALSYVVSFIGAASTLELINRRTAPKGIFNHLLLFSAAVTMGGIAIWCMHYIGNRAINMANGEAELQIAYSSGFTGLSFFVPIMVLMAAFLAIGTSNEVAWWRVATGGTLAGAAICGMHYLGNASISNYACIYNTVNVAFAALIAVAASITALSLFFVFRASWTNSWWKRGGTAVVLAGAVSGMHWCASTGTEYKLVGLNSGANETSRNTMVIIVICLSIGACFIIAGTAIYTARVMSRYAHKAEQVVLATAIFDKQGRVLVSPEGLLPSEKITDSFLEKTSQDAFSVAHPLFQWMFQASRNWSNISSIVNVMIDHLRRLPHLGRDISRNGIKLVDERGELIENYDIIFKELFCAAASALAEKTKSNIRQVGILWDEILPTGTGGDVRHQQQSRRSNPSNGSDDGLAEKGEVLPRAQELYRGSLMFLVRRVESARETTALEAAGYRFADVHQVSLIISSSMQIKAGNVEAKLADMAKYAQEESTRLGAGVHLGFFAVRARVGNFEVLVRSAARHLLPSVEIPIDHLEPWQLNFLKQLNGLTPAGVVKALEHRRQLSAQDIFASQIITSLNLLRNEVEDEIFEEATLTAKVVQVPCRSETASPSSSSANTVSLIAFKLSVPIHQHVRCPGLEFVPLSLFKVHQLVYKDSPHNLIFSRSVHREISPILNAIPIPVQRTRTSDTTPRQQGILFLAPNPFRRLRTNLLRRKPAARLPTAIDADGNPIPTVYGRLGRSGRSGSTHSSSTLKLWNPAPNSGGSSRPEERSSSCVDVEGDDNIPKPSPAFGGVENYDSTGSTTSDLPRSSPAPTQLSGSLGGIMVSQEVTVNIHDEGRPVTSPEVPRHRSKSTIAIEMQPWGNKAGVTVQAESAAEMKTFVDELFAVCIGGVKSEIPGY